MKTTTCAQASQRVSPADEHSVECEDDPRHRLEEGEHQESRGDQCRDSGVVAVPLGQPRP